MREVTEQEIFETLPVNKAVATLAIPTIISQIVSIILGFVVCFVGFAPWLLQAFIRNRQTSLLGTTFLRIACLAVPFTSVNALIIYTLQAMGKGFQAAVLTLCRQGLLNIPLLILLNRIFGLYGMIWTQLVIELIMLPATSGMYMVTWKRLRKDE